MSKGGRQEAGGKEREKKTGSGFLALAFPSHRPRLDGILRNVVLNGGLDGILREHAAVQLDGRQLEVAGDVRVLDGQHILHGAPLDPLGRHGAGGDGGAAAKGLELGVDDAAVGADLDLEEWWGRGPRWVREV